MPVTTLTIKESFICNGSLNDFGFSFPVDDADDVRVMVRDPDGVAIQLALVTDFEVSTENLDYSEGGMVTTVSYSSGARESYAWPDGYTLTVYRETPLTQESAYRNNRAFDQAVLTKDLDRIYMVKQELHDALGRSIKIPIDDASMDSGLPPASERVNTYLAFDAVGAPIASAGTPGEVPISSFMGVFVGLANGEEAREYLAAVGAASATVEKLRITEDACFDAEYDNGNSGAAKIINWGNGNKQAITLTAPCVLTFVAPAGVGHFQLRVVQGGAGGYTLSINPSILWMEKTAPILSTAAGAEDFLTFFWNASHYYGTALLDFGTP